MQFFGDVGGFQGSLFMIGAALNFFFSGNNQGMQLLQEFFLVSEAKYNPSKRGKWLRSFGKADAGWL